MKITDFLTPEMIAPSLKGQTKPEVLQELAGCLTREHPEIPLAEMSTVLAERERLGSTAIGDGIAIPHGKLAKCGRIFGVFGRLERPIDFDALDGLPVDLTFLLIAPENAGADHLKALALISRALRSPGLAAKLRATRDASAIFSLLTLTPTSHAA